MEKARKEQGLGTKVQESSCGWFGTPQGAPKDKMIKAKFLPEQALA